ncbi:cell division protein ZapE [Thiococcus pfennigii]|uniref:cell division protein ZapE n=1 Tax=Thiococcus pfennigii TaxID=1057 RepID=UPI001906E73F|nr:cell division protein ZapE [Thiococcus pfennigii]
MIRTPLPADFTPFDPSQRAVAEQLAALHAALAATPARPSDPPGRGLLRRWRRPTEATPVPGLYLWGPVGRGKTYLMDWFVEALPLPGKRRLHFHHFMRDIHASLAGLPKQPDPLEVVAEQLRREVRVLCLDEFLVNDIADAMILYGLLRALFARGLTLVTTANTPPRELYRNGLQRQRFLPAIELLERHTRVVELTGTTDYRLRTLTAAGVYFVAADGAADTELERCFAQLTGQHRSPDTTLTVNGRKIPVRGVGADVVWLDFAALCGSARATADYIELAREFNTLLLSDVPVLTARHEAAARRFVHLVDELYDRRIKLILSAAAPLAELYGGDLEHFPHERLLSRLTEMQSAAYMAACAGEPRRR